MTPGRKVKTALLATVASWVLKTWQDLPGDMVERSFKKCSISNTFNGRECEIWWEKEETSTPEKENEEKDEDRYNDKLTEEQWRNLFAKSNDKDKLVACSNSQ